MDKPEKPAPPDVALIHGRTADGEGLRILRSREGRLELGDIRPLKEGKAIQGEVVSLKPRAECPALCDVTVEVEAPRGAASPPHQHGPAQVASETYRQNWERIFSRPAAAPKLAN